MGELTVFEFIKQVPTSDDYKRETIKSIKPVSDTDAIKCIAIIMKEWNFGTLEYIKDTHPLFLELYEKTKIIMSYSSLYVRIDKSMTEAYKATGEPWTRYNKERGQRRRGDRVPSYGWLDGI